MLLGNAIKATRACAIRTRQRFRFAARCLDLKICTCLMSKSSRAFFAKSPMGFPGPDSSMCKRRGEGAPAGARRGHCFVASTVGRESILEPCSHPRGDANQPRNENSSILPLASFLLDDSPDFLNYYPFENQQLST